MKLTAITITALLTSTASALVTCNNLESRTGSRGYFVFLPTKSGSVECEMGRGSNSNAVLTLQITLNSKCYGYGLEEDGDFGRNTEAALIKAQNKHDAAADGIYGPETRKKMRWDAYNDDYVVSCRKISET
ncbi:peptidoglycan-binding protein [Microdochium nivale]|nr:peptidoglycan-binding protein [Microdochium nivale]